MKSPPDFSQYLHPAAVEDGVFLPPEEFFVQETVHWRKYLRGTQVLHPLDKAIAEHLVNDLRTFASGRDVAPLLALSSKFEGNAEAGQEVQRWSASMQSRIAFSRFWHEKHFLQGVEISLSSPDEPPAIFADFPIYDFSKGGLHAKRDFIEGIGLVYPHSRLPIWHEGEQVFVRVSVPAVQTEENKALGPFEPDQFATVMPFLKREIWEGAVAIEAPE